jgi:hypothetical protein
VATCLNAPCRLMNQCHVRSVSTHCAIACVCITRFHRALDPVMAETTAPTQVHLFVRYLRADLRSVAGTPLTGGQWPSLDEADRAVLSAERRLSFMPDPKRARTLAPPPPQAQAAMCINPGEALGEGEYGEDVNFAFLRNNRPHDNTNEHGSNSNERRQGSRKRRHENGPALQRGGAGVEPEGPGAAATA